MTTVFEVPLATVDCVRFVIIERCDLVKNRRKSFHGYTRCRLVGAAFIDFRKALRIQEDDLQVAELVRLAIAGRGAAG
ncbi:MAG: hypothetical protein V3W08_05295 [Candidatus Binatia bacterium]